MKVARPSQVAREPYLNDIFTGPGVMRQPVATGSLDYNVNIIAFSKGTRTRFHTHESEQVLIVTSGVGIVATETEEHRVTTGDVILVPAGETHRHGATLDSEFAHISLTRTGSETRIVGE